MLFYDKSSSGTINIGVIVAKAVQSYNLWLVFVEAFQFWVLSRCILNALPCRGVIGEDALLQSLSKSIKFGCFSVEFPKNFSDGV